MWRTDEASRAASKGQLVITVRYNGRHSPLSVATVVLTSTSAGPSLHRPELEIAGRPARMLIDQSRSIDIDYIVRDPVDHLSRDELAEVELALAHYLGVQDAGQSRSANPH